MFQMFFFIMKELKHERQKIVYFKQLNIFIFLFASTFYISLFTECLTLSLET